MLGCKRVLRRDGYVDHDCDPFCQACYSRLFKPKGYGFGASTFSTDYGSPVSEQPKVDGTELQVVFPLPKVIHVYVLSKMEVVVIVLQRRY